MTVTLTALEWDGDLPMPGQYLKAARGRTAFMILDIRKPSAGAKYVARFVCEREPVAALPADAVVYHWEWARR